MSRIGVMDNELNPIAGKLHVYNNRVRVLSMIPLDILYELYNKKGRKSELIEEMATNWNSDLATTVLAYLRRATTYKRTEEEITNDAVRRCMLVQEMRKTLSASDIAIKLNVSAARINWLVNRADRIRLWYENHPDYHPDNPKYASE